MCWKTVYNIIKKTDALIEKWAWTMNIWPTEKIIQVDNSSMKINKTSLIIKEVQVKTKHDSYFMGAYETAFPPLILGNSICHWPLSQVLWNEWLGLLGLFSLAKDSKHLSKGLCLVRSKLTREEQKDHWEDTKMIQNTWW